MSHSLGSGSGAKEAGILELNFSELLVVVHLDDEWHNQDQEVGVGDHAALPALRRSFLDTMAALEAARLAWMTMDDWDTLRLALDIRECSLSLPWVTRFFP